jgi:hypothetical protein
MLIARRHTETHRTLAAFSTRWRPFIVARRLHTAAAAAPFRRVAFRVVLTLLTDHHTLLVEADLAWLARLHGVADWQAALVVSLLLVAEIHADLSGPARLAAAHQDGAAPIKADPTFVTVRVLVAADDVHTHTRRLHRAQR